MKKLLLFLALWPSLAFAGIYTNDFSNGTQPPADWTEYEEEGTGSFICDSVSFPGEDVGFLHVGSTQYPLIVVGYDDGMGWTISSIEFTVRARGYWTIVELYGRYDYDGAGTYYSAIFDISNSTLELYKNGDDIDTNSYTLANGDVIKFEFTGTDPLTIKVYVNDVERMSAVDSSSPLTTGTMALGLIAMQDYLSTDLYIDDLEIVHDGGDAPPTGRKKTKGIGNNPTGWIKKIYQWGY